MKTNDIITSYLCVFTDDSYNPFNGKLQKGVPKVALCIFNDNKVGSLFIHLDTAINKITGERFFTGTCLQPDITHEDISSLFLSEENPTQEELSYFKMLYGDILHGELIELLSRIKGDGTYSKFLD